jgi:hypothetical protein
MAIRFTTIRLSLIVLAFAVVVGLLLSRLDHYALWDDEVGLAIPSRQVWQTGDTSVVSGENIMAPRGGVILKDLKDRANPPLPAFFLAPIAGLFLGNKFMLRLPFALCGLACIGIMLYGALKITVSERLLVILIIGMVGNVSLFLYFRQVRYYGLVVLFCTWASFIYLYARKTPFSMFLLTTLLFGIFASNYMVFAAYLSALVVDYYIWQRREFRIGRTEVASFILPLALFCLSVLLVWNPYATQIKAQASMNSLADRLTLLWWNLRDINTNEFGSLMCLTLSPVLYFLGPKNPWLLRGPTGIFVYCLILSAVSPQPTSLTSVADVRYAAPLIPLCIITTAVFLCTVTSRLNIFFAIGISILVFWTNITNSLFWIQGSPRSTILSYVGELYSPPDEPFSPTSDWINKNVHKGGSIWVLPDYMTYPLMFHAPTAVYAWQLRPEQKNEEQFKDLSDIHFQGLVSPDFIVAFGPSVQQVRQLIGQWSMHGLRYEEKTRIMTFWKDLYRPELFWRTFKPVENYDSNTEAIYIFKRQP